MNQSLQEPVLVTGGSGFLGGAVLRHLGQANCEVSAVARSQSAAMKVRAAGATAIAGDLDAAESIVEAFKKATPTRLVNLASLGFGHAPTIVRAAEEAGIERAVFVSTTAIFTRLDTPSKVVRITAEETIRDSRLAWTIVRPTMIYGSPDDRNMWRLLRQLRVAPVVVAPGGAHHLHQPVHVEDVAAAVVAALESESTVAKSYDLAGPEPLTFGAIVRSAGYALGRTVRVVPVPARPLIRILELVERSGRSLPVRSEQIERLLEDKCFDISAAVKDFGYAPRSFDDGIGAEARLMK